MCPGVQTPGKSIALIGPHSRTQKDLAGNYFEDIGLGTCAGPACVPSIESSINALNEGSNVTVVEACSDMKCGTADIAGAVAAAKGADVVVMAMGISGAIEGEAHDRMDIGMPGGYSYSYSCHGLIYSGFGH